MIFDEVWQCTVFQISLTTVHTFFLGVLFSDIFIDFVDNIEATTSGCCHFRGSHWPKASKKAGGRRNRGCRGKFSRESKRQRKSCRRDCRWWGVSEFRCVYPYQSCTQFALCSDEARSGASTSIQSSACIYNVREDLALEVFMFFLAQVVGLIPPAVLIGISLGDCGYFHFTVGPHGVLIHARQCQWFDWVLARYSG